MTIDPRRRKGTVIVSVHRLHWDSTNDALLDLVHQETQSNQLAKQAQPSATYWQFSTRLRWPERFKGVVMAVLLQLRSQRSSDFH